jgi:hypothetical protein
MCKWVQGGVIFAKTKLGVRQKVVRFQVVCKPSCQVIAVLSLAVY